MFKKATFDETEQCNLQGSFINKAQGFPKKEIILSSIIATYTPQNVDVNVGLKLTGLNQVI